MSRDDAAGRLPTVVVGAGLTGLVLGRELARRGSRPLVLEAAARPGGVIRTLEADGRVLEAGPQRTRLVEPVARLVEELALGDRMIEAPEGLPLFVYADGRLRRVPTSPWGWAAGDLLSARGRLRLLAEPLTGPAREGETVRGWAVRRLGREAYDRVVGPLYGGIYGSDPAEMPFRLTLGRTLERLGLQGRSVVAAAARWMAAGASTPPAVTFRDGMEELPRALYREDEDRVRLETPVRSLRPAGGGGWLVEAGEGTVRARAVVLTCPADRAAAILEAAAPGAAGRLAAVRYNPLAVVHLASEAGLEGYGYQVALPEGLATRGVTFNESLFGRPRVYTAYLGGATAPGVPDRPDGEVGELAAREFRRVTGHRARLLGVSRTRMPAWDRSREALEGMELPEGVRLCAPYESRPGIPGRLEAAARLAEELTLGRR